MQSVTQTSRLSIQQKLGISYVIGTLISILVMSGLCWAFERWLDFQIQGFWRVLIIAIGAALIELALGLWSTDFIISRLDRAAEISRAWLRGNLSLRILDPVSDELGTVVQNMNLLVESLEDDEQDLEELRQRNVRLTDQVRALAVVEERNRLARELHDSVKQQLFSLTMTASAIQAQFSKLSAIPDDMDEMVSEMTLAAQTAQREMTRLIKDLRPASLHEQGLAASLNDYTLLFGAQEHLLIYLEVEGDDKLLPPSVVEVVYRVAQEALHNVARHARATRVDVQLRCFSGRVALTVHDNGVGFDIGQAREGFGISNMQERLMTVGGRLVIDSQLGVGTTVIAEVGLPHPIGWYTGGGEMGALRPDIEQWHWLGQRLVIPVGQTWPWLPADQRHLRRPLIEPLAEGTPFKVKYIAGFLGLNRGYVIQQGDEILPLVRVYYNYNQAHHEWRVGDASWELRRIKGGSGRGVLVRNDQPLAALQYRGRQLHTWSEIVYDSRSYKLSYYKNHPGRYTLVNEVGDEVLTVEGQRRLEITLCNPVPLPLLIMVTARIVEEMAAAKE
ncbi:MAG: sensor histidine kinase [Anaerolineae bacterium]|nr:sensor histidine kinase [Anaerolineae bacterium]